MRRFVPAFVEEKRRAGILRGSLPAAVLFADVSGFTTLTERAFAGGDGAAELLYAALRAVFDPMVQEVATAGGFVAGFAGDAFTAVFPDAPGIPAAPSCRAAARRILERTNVRTPLGEVAIEVRCGVAAGDVSWGLLRSVAPGVAPMAPTRTTDLAEIRRRAALREKQRHAWYFRGPAVDGAAAIASSARAARAPTASEPDGPDVRPLPPAPEDPELPDGTLRLYFPDALVDAGETPELRHVAAVFAKLEGTLEHAALEQLHATLLPLCEDHGGTLNKIDFGDKGATLYLHFGAPRFLEHPEAAAVGFARSLVEDVLPGFPGLAARVGIDAGRAYCGILGGAHRNEWTCTGNPVNTAARLMMLAAPGEVLVSDPVRRPAGAFAYEPRGSRWLKGRTAEVALHALTGRARPGQAARARTPFVGRTAEIERVAAFIERRLAGPGDGTALVVSGDEGLGKSRLVAESVGRAGARCPMDWVAIRGDALLHRGWSALQPWLEAELLTEGDPAARRLGVEAAYARLAAGSPPRVREDLDRTRPFVGELLGCRWEGSLYETVTDAALRHANRIAGVVAILRARAAMARVVLTVDDAQHLDACSAEAIRAVVQAARGSVLAVVMTCRASEDRLPIPSSSAVERLELQPLDAGDVARTLAGELVEGTLRDDVLALVADRAQGNPAFTAMLLEHLGQGGRLVDDGGGRLRLAADPGDLPATVASLLTARLDGLSPDAREALKAGSVLGAEIHAPILAGLLEWDVRRTGEALAEAASRGLLAPGARGGLAFRPAALRHAVDSLLMPLARAALHARALAHAEDAGGPGAEAADDDLAWHAREARKAAGADDAALAAKERHHLAAAAARAYGQCDYRSAESLLSRLLELTPAGGPEHVDVVHRLWNVKLLLGRNAEAEALAAAALQAARDGGDGTAEVRALTMRSIMRQQAFRLDEAESIDDEILRLATSRGDSVAAAQARMRRANVWRAKGDPARARPEYAAALRTLPEGHGAERALILANEASVLLELGDAAAAEEAFRSALAEARARGDLRAVAFRLANLSGVLWASGAAGDAERAAAEAVEIATRIGARTAEISARGHLGGFQLLAGRLREAAATFAAVLRLTQEIDDPRGEAESYWHLAAIDRHAGRLGDASAGFAQCIDVATRHDDAMHAAQGHLGEALVALDRGDLPGVARALDAARALRIEAPRVAMALVVAEGVLAARRGDVPAAVAALRAGAGGSQSLQDVGAEALVRLAGVLLDAGRDAEAGAVIEDAAPLCRRECAALAWLARQGLSSRLLLRQGRAGEAATVAREAEVAAGLMGALTLRVVAGLAPLFDALRVLAPDDAGTLRRAVETMEGIVRDLDLGDTSDAGRAAARCRAALAPSG